MRAALLQLPVSGDVKKDLSRAAQAAQRAAQNGASLCVLPEMFACPYANDWFVKLAEPRGGQVWTAMSDAARRSGITLVAGSFPELDGGRIYNSSFVFGPDGRELARHRKVHLFDINVDGGQSFCESRTFSAGDSVTVFEAEGHKFGLCICFDIRFPELFRAMVAKGAEAVIVPAAFNMTTGPLHWELTFRARALDNQIFTLGAAPARDENACYVSYANSIFCSPWGQVVARAGTGEQTLMCDMDFSLVQSVRRQLPLLSARRPEVY